MLYLFTLIPLRLSTYISLYLCTLYHYHIPYTFSLSIYLPLYTISTQSLSISLHSLPPHQHTIIISSFLHSLYLSVPTLYLSTLSVYISILHLHSSHTLYICTLYFSTFLLLYTLSLYLSTHSHYIYLHSISLSLYILSIYTLSIYPPHQHTLFLFFFYMIYTLRSVF